MLQGSDLLYEVEVPGPPTTLCLYGNTGGNHKNLSSQYILYYVSNLQSAEFSPHKIFIFLNVSSTEAHAYRDLFFFFFFFVVFLDFHELWRSVMSVCSLKLSGNGLRWYWDGWPLRCTTHVSDDFALKLVDRNPFWPCCFFSVLQ